VDIADLRDEFPTLRKLVYLNAGTDGPLPARAVKAAEAELERAMLRGRWREHFERRKELGDALRARYGALLGCEPAEVALTTSTSEGISLVLAGLELCEGDEILTSDEEHPGMLGALGAARELHGVRVREVPLSDVASSVGPSTRLLACCHVGWMSGSLAPAGLGEVGVPVLLDGAQGVGAVPVDVRALGCDAYAGAGQKWLCGPDGTGMLYVSGALREQLAVSRRGYPNLENPDAGLDARLHEDSRRFDALGLSAEALACALGACELLEEWGWPALHERALTLAALFAQSISEAGREVAPRGPSTLVSFRSAEPERERDMLGALGVILRDIPSRPWLRVSVGAWNDEGDLERLLGALTSS
jgi:selenocysteine lyase/cysteine desulfurase